MKRARRHQRFSAGLAFGLLALIAELHGSQPHAPSRRRPPRRLALLGRRVLPVPARRGEARRSAPAGAARLALRPGAHGRSGRTAGAGNRRQERGAAAAPAARPLAAALDARLPHDLDLLPPADRRRAGRLRALAAARALAAQLGAARLRRARRARRARLERGRLLAARVRALRRGHLCPRRQDRPPGRAAARRARAHELPPPRENCSASPSRAVRRPSPRSPRTTPRARGTLSSRPGEVE